MPLIKFFGNLRQLAQSSRLPVEGKSVGGILNELCRQNLALGEAIFENGQLRPHVRVVVNGHDVALEQGLDTPVEENDQVAIFPPLGGG
jgi:molybdopterin synthase sulfur carrier subunit